MAVSAFFSNTAVPLRTSITMALCPLIWLLFKSPGRLGSYSSLEEIADENGMSMNRTAAMHNKRTGDLFKKPSPFIECQWGKAKTAAPPQASIVSQISLFV
ncbi:hypothetical protein SDC9_127589 [bioreactor metagenome]|uniref:Uncharacterized protein n=1 Tax=bioreactor metagenome TaxID=1076179 RepID=A0A645CV03_9ZZZZ